MVKHTGSHYLVSSLPDWNLINCVVRGKMRIKDLHTTNPIAVGDHIEYKLQEDGSGVITKIHPRTNYIIRKSTNLSRRAHIIAANIDVAFLIVTLDFPETKWAFVDRFLVTCEAYKVPATIILNKTDLFTHEHLAMLQLFKDIYGKAGYNIIEVSVKTGHNIDLLRDECKGKLSLFSGISGVGKSSLINSLDNTLSLKTGKISDYHLQGKHTTTFYEIHPLKSGGYIIDTPGIKGFGLVEMSVEELSHYFPEMFKIIDKCKFAPCTHTHEPGCAIKEAIDNGGLAPERYISYLGMMEEESKYR